MFLSLNLSPTVQRSCQCGGSSRDPGLRPHSSFRAVFQRCFAHQCPTNNMSANTTYVAVPLVLCAQFVRPIATFSEFRRVARALGLPACPGLAPPKNGGGSPIQLLMTGDPAVWLLTQCFPSPRFDFHQGDRCPARSCVHVLRNLADHPRAYRI